MSSDRKETKEEWKARMRSISFDMRSINVPKRRHDNPPILNTPSLNPYSVPDPGKSYRIGRAMEGRTWKDDMEKAIESAHA